MKIKIYLWAVLALSLTGCATTEKHFSTKEVYCPLTGVVVGGAAGLGAGSAGLLAPVGALAGGLIADNLCGNEQASVSDLDGDGVADKDDQCPGTEAGVEVNAQGCPLDADMDGVEDAKDSCPDTAKGVEVDAIGCGPDADMDGIEDQKDQCPNTPKGAKVDVACAPYVTVENNYFVSAKPVLFATASAEVDGEGMKVLQCIVDAAKGTLSDLDVAGYTDSVGSAAANKRLSKRRAENVFSILVEKGFDKEKLHVIGFGMTDPAASNKTEESRALNRRVEIRPRY